MEPMTEHMPRVSVDPISLGMQKWELPPLILHPFSDQSGPGKLVQSSRASLMLNGLLPHDESSEDELTRKLLEGRICEIWSVIRNSPWKTQRAIARRYGALDASSLITVRWTGN